MSERRKNVGNAVFLGALYQRSFIVSVYIIRRRRRPATDRIKLLCLFLRIPAMAIPSLATG